MDPLAALLAEHKHESTVLDQHFKMTQNKQQTMPIKEEASEDDEDEAPIGLTYRQPSFSSLHSGDLVVKGGLVVSDLSEVKEEDPVIVLDDHAEQEDAPIGLGYRQPSFSLLDRNLTAKGGESVHNVRQFAAMAINEEQENGEIADDVFEEDEEEDDLQVAIVKELQVRNSKRWEEMGYKPPDNVIELTRAQSHNVFTQRTLLEQPARSPLLFAPEVIEEDPTPEPEPEPEPPKFTPTPRHRRCGSSGMELGEASTSLARMSQALMITPKVTETAAPEEIVEEILEEEEEGFIFEEEEEEEEEFMLEEEEEAKDEAEEQNDEDLVEDPALFGNLSLIIREPKDGVVYKALTTNELNFTMEETEAIKEKLKKYQEICIENIWVDETSYLNELMTTLDLNQQNKVTEEMSELEKTKVEGKQSIAKYDRLIEQEKLKLRKAIERMEDEYKQKAADLDEKYQSEEILEKYNQPSQQLLAMREKCREYLRKNRIEEARRERAKIQTQETKEAKQMSAKIRDEYYAADRRLKEDYALERELIQRKFKYQIEKLQRDKQDAQKKYKERTSALAKPVSASRLHTSQEIAAPLKLKLPKPLPRGNDSRVIEAMSQEVARGRHVYEIDIDSAFRKLKK